LGAFRYSHGFLLHGSPFSSASGVIGVSPVFIRRVATHLMFVGIFLDTTLELIALFEAH
jgi:hypothetical protein